jgi:A1 cistron-splicing factor AAR2
MDQQKANELINRCATILCLNVPPRVEFGIDNHSWIVGDKFKGVKLIPPGTHFVFYSATNKYGGDSAPRTSFFVFLKEGDVIVKKWNPKNEDLEDETDKDQLEAYIQGVRRFEFDQYLGAYPYDSLEQWRGLTSHITEKVLNKFAPVGNSIDATTKPFEDDDNQTKVENATVNQRGSTRKPYYTEIPSRRLPKNADNSFLKSHASEVTQFNLDKSAIFLELVQTEYENDMSLVLGELQFAFVAFLMGQSYESFEQWKNLITILCQCDSAMQQYPQFFDEFITVFYHQLKEVPEDFFVDIIAGNNFIVQILKVSINTR